MGTGMSVYNELSCIYFYLYSVLPHFAQNVERSVTTLTKDPHGDIDEPQFIDASKLVSNVVQLQIGLADNFVYYA